MTFAPATKFNATIALSRHGGNYVHVFGGDSKPVSAKRMREQILPEIFTSEVQAATVRATDLASLMRWDAPTLVAPGEPEAQLRLARRSSRSA